MATVSLLLATATAMSACGSAEPAPQETTPAVPQAGEFCPGMVGDGKPVRFGPDDALAGVLLGAGATGLVLGHQANQNLCSWLPDGHRLAGHGYRALAIDFANNGSSGPVPAGRVFADDMVDAAAYLRAQGVTTVVLIGASMGGTAALVAAAQVKPPVAGVVSFSGPALYSGMDAETAVRSLTVPVLYLAGSADHPFDTAAAFLAKATPKGLGTLVVVSSSSHGEVLLAAVEANRAFDAFLKAHAPIGG